TNDSIIYLGGGDHNYYSTGSGVWKSTNAGNTFTQTTLTGKIVVEMVMDPTNNQVIVAATNTGIYKTTNAGSTWTLKSAARTFDDLKQKTPTSRTLYAATTDSAFFRSTDFGETWTQINNGIVLPTSVTTGGGCRVAVTPADTNVVYFGMAGNAGMLYKSTDGGSSFTGMKTSASPYLTYYTNLSTDVGQGDYNFGIGVDRTNANIIYMVAHAVWKSIDGV
ncbi:MAG: WD40/YVTN/BNR-like repeat-containing protein, partial [Bacteroidota bacterium]